MKIKSLNTRKKEIFFLASGIITLLIVAGILFFFSQSLAGKLEQAYSNNAVNVKPEQIQFEKYEEIIEAVFPSNPTSTPSGPEVLTEKPKT